MKRLLYVLSLAVGFYIGFTQCSCTDDLPACPADCKTATCTRTGKCSCNGQQCQQLEWQQRPDAARDSL